jgi:Uncharacterized protein conserved in bacteria
MKKLLALLLVLALVLTVVGCTGGAEVSVSEEVLSSGSDKVEVPDVYNMSYDEAKKALVAAGFTVKQVEKSSEDVAGGHVILTNPPRGELLDKGTEVAVYVSVISDSSWALMPIPKVVGLAEDNAWQVCATAGLSVEVVYKEDSAPKGTVIEQSLTAGKRVQEVDAIILTVSTGVKEQL